MKARNNPFLRFAALATLTILPGSLYAADRVRNNTENILVSDSAWTTVAPSSSDRAVWNSSSVGGATTLGGDAAWQGILVSGGTPSSGPLFTNAVNPDAFTLALGSAGIDLNSGGNTNRGITFESNTKLDLAADQTWKLGLGVSTAANIVVNSVISGTGSLKITRDAASNNLLQLSGANTFTGGFTLNPGAIVNIGVAAVFSASGTTSSALGSYDGTQFLTINGGRINSGNFSFHARDAKINGDFTFATTARTEFRGNYDLQNGTRTMTLTRSATAANTVTQGGNLALRFSLDNEITSFSNGTLRLAADAGIAEGNFVPVIANFGTAFTANAGLTLGPKVVFSAGTANLNDASAVPSVTLEAGSYWNLAEGAAVRNPQVNSLAGAGTVLSAGTATAGTAYTLTIRGNSGTVSDFSGSVVNSDTTTFSTSTAGIVGVTKEGSTTQIFSGSNTYTGATAVKAGTLLIGTNGSLANTAVTVGGAGTTGTPTLGGGGTIGGVTSIAAAGSGVVGTHAVGITGVSDGVGTQTFTSTLDYGSGSIFEWNLQAIGTTDVGVVADVATGTYDKVIASGAVNSVTGSGAIFKIVLGGNAFTDAFWNTDKTWTDIFSGTGAPSDLSSIFTTFSGTNVNTNGTVTGRIGQFSFNGSSTLTWSAIPEPSSALAGLLIIAGLLRRRRA